MVKIAILSMSDLTRDPRVNRQIRTLHKNYDIITAGFCPCEIDSIPFFKITYFGSKIYQRALLMSIKKQYESFYNSTANFDELKQFIYKEQPDIIYANDFDTLPFAIQFRNQAKIIFDAHEYSPLEQEESFLFRCLFKPYRLFLMRKNLSYVDRMITVSDGIAEKYFEEMGVKSSVITNAPDYENLAPRKPGQILKIVHHGVAHPSRGIEEMINVLKYIDPNRFEFHLYLTNTNSRYYNKLKRFQRKFSNLYFHNPVCMRDLPSVLNQYDIGLYALPPVNFNNLHALPNKFYEYIQARLGVVIGPSPEMEKIVKKHNLGVIATGFTTKELANTIKNLNDIKIEQYKNNAHSVARKLSAEENMNKILSLILGLIDTGNA